MWFYFLILYYIFKPVISGRDVTKSKWQHKKHKKKNQGSSSKFHCYGCGDLGHVKTDCPNAKKSEEKKGRKFFKKKKWGNESSSSSSSSSSLSDSDKEANLCLMGHKESHGSQVSVLATMMNMMNYMMYFNNYFINLVNYMLLINN